MQYDRLKTELHSLGFIIFFTDFANGHYTYRHFFLFILLIISTITTKHTSLQYFTHSLK